MRVALTTLGCRLNEAELENWSHDFQSLGHTISTRAEEADVLVVNTCAVTREAVKKSRQQIRKYRRKNPLAKLVVSGCYASLNPEIKQQLDGVDLLVNNRDKDRLADIVDETLVDAAMPKTATDSLAPALFARGRNRAFIKVQDGCRYRCTFCIVTLARGEERSRPINAIVEEINRLSGQGVLEVVLSGVHIGGYGSDTNSSLYELVKTVLQDTDIPRIRLGSVEPWDLDEAFPGLFSNPRFMPHLHLPLQSGSDTVLRRMARRCQTREFRRLVNGLREQHPQFSVSTDIIVGFPGESESDWREGLDFIATCDFSHIHIFPYSPREGTKAATMNGQLPHGLKKQRCVELNALALQMRERVLQSQTGVSCPVLFENEVNEADRDGRTYTGYTPNYLRVRATTSSATSLRNQIHPVRLLSVDSKGGFLRASEPVTG